MAFALYTVCVASFCTVYGHRLALQGPTGSVKKSVAVMKKQLQGLYRTFGLSMFSLVMAGVMMAWVKMGQAAALVTFVFIAFFVLLLYKFSVIYKLFYIPEHLTVTGELKLSQVGNPTGGEIDLAELQSSEQRKPSARPSVRSGKLSAPSPRGNVPQLGPGSASVSQPEQSQSSDWTPDDTPRGGAPRPDDASNRNFLSDIKDTFFGKQPV